MPPDNTINQPNQSQQQKPGKGPGKGFVAVLVAIPILVVVVVTYFMMIAPALRDHNLRANGIDGTATITSVEQTGNMYNYNPELRIGLLVHPQSGADYHATSTQVFQQLLLSNIHVGGSVDVKISKDNPEDLTITALNGVQ